ncbi:MAG: PIG-L family deacetylase [Chloroflexota bacterium]|jgi:LmbE family N-acetylglucosaminyl deacetylase
MESRYETIYLSPHLDDAILSCGGQIYQLTRAGKSALIVTIMAGDAPADGLSEFALGLHQRWQLAGDAAAQRRQEDRAACRVVGADYLHLNLLDCIYRRDPGTGAALYDSEEALFDELHPAERALARTLADTLGRLPDSNRVLAPLTVGGHIDHQLTRLAAEIWLGDNLTYYEEYPYALSPQAMPAEIVLEGRWRASTVPISDEALAARIEAIACYKSQLSTFFHDHEALIRSVSGYVHQVGGERLWHRIVP